MIRNERNFWSTTRYERYHDLAREFEQNVERYHPGTITSDGRGTRLFHHDSWYASCVTYYRYNGPQQNAQ